jgi:tetratricopeptide (TPR) repeat protein
MAVALNNLAQVLRLQRRYAEAEPLYRQALDIWKERLGPVHADVALGMVNLAGLYYDAGRYKAAERAYRRAFEISGKTLGADSPRTASQGVLLAEALLAMGRGAEAAPLYARWVPVLQANPDAPRDVTQRALAVYGKLPASAHQGAGGGAH